MTNREYLRCQPGDRARITNALMRENVGKIVAVVRAYVDGEPINGHTWAVPKPSWVIVPIGAPIKSEDNKGNIFHDWTAVMRDEWLLPLSDSEGGVEGVSALRATRSITLRRTTTAKGSAS